MYSYKFRNILNNRSIIHLFTTVCHKIPVKNVKVKTSIYVKLFFVVEG